MVGYKTQRRRCQPVVSEQRTIEKIRPIPPPLKEAFRKLDANATLEQRQLGLWD
jgi:hypothetical protein